MRRRLRAWLARAAAWSIWLAVPLAAAEELPQGASPAPIPAAHFPSPVHAVVWRNWDLVGPAGIAKTLATSEENVTALAASLGLPPAGQIAPDWRRRGYITLLRRNWHLLPYQQLLTLLEMSPEQLALALREDDFLYQKLGSCKPRCATVRYEPPNAAQRARAAEIRELVERHFGAEMRRPAEAPFAFVDQLSRLPEKQSPPRDRARPTGTRCIYSYFGTFGDPLADAQLNPYPDGLLARLGEAGVNGVWLHVVLRQLAPGGPLFSDLDAGHQQRLANLRRLVERAGRQGIGVYLYLNEPRALPASWFAGAPQRAELAGAPEQDYRALCTSDQRVRRWLADSVAHVFREVPELAGVFTITASENLTHCASHGQQGQCPRCRARSAADVIAEVNATIAEGARRASPRARVIAWDWGWNGHGDARETIAKLPKNVALMSVSEWALPIERGGVRSTVGEYSLSAVGPGPRADSHWEAARRAGLETFAKVQLNNTWELAAVPYLPVLDLVARHCENLARARVDGMLLSWSLGGYPSLNLRVAQRFAENPQAQRDDVLDELAREAYGAAGAAPARRAWTAMSRAFEQFPFDGAVLYRAPQQLGPANPLYLAPTGYPSTMTGFAYDDLAGWRGMYPPEVFAGQFARLAAGWAEGLAELERAVVGAPLERQAAARADLRVAQAAQLHFASVANQARFVLARDAPAGDGSTTTRRDELSRLANDEIRLARQLFRLARADSRIGFEAANQYFYLPLDLIEKVIVCEHVKAIVAGGSR